MNLRYRLNWIILAILLLGMVSLLLYTWQTEPRVELNAELLNQKLTNALFIVTGLMLDILDA